MIINAACSACFVQRLTHPLSSRVPEPKTSFILCRVRLRERFRMSIPNGRASRNARFSGTKAMNHQTRKRSGVSSHPRIHIINVINERVNFPATALRIVQIGLHEVSAPQHVPELLRCRGAGESCSGCLSLTACVLDLR